MFSLCYMFPQCQQKHGQEDKHLQLVLSVSNIEICEAKLVETELLHRLEVFSGGWIGKHPFQGVAVLALLKSTIDPLFFS